MENNKFSIPGLKTLFFSLFPSALIIPPKNRQLGSKNIQWSLNERFLAGKPTARPDLFTQSSCLCRPTLHQVPVSRLASYLLTQLISTAACKGRLRGSHPLPSLLGRLQKLGSVWLPSNPPPRERLLSCREEGVCRSFLLRDLPSCCAWSTGVSLGWPWELAAEEQHSWTQLSSFFFLSSHPVPPSRLQTQSVQQPQRGKSWDLFYDFQSQQKAWKLNRTCKALQLHG